MTKPAWGRLCFWFGGGSAMSFATLALAGQRHIVEAAMQASLRGFGVMPVKRRQVSNRIAKLLAVA
ncbi:hypothetical protein [Burkholderia cepacia]|uniref:hypothetical protein n=1 Tax=Burkholderia cepacia TaxID=292 RepID=UPI002ABEA287|nr:hypothetical protein [Burkholderia cepacia]